MNVFVYFCAVMFFLFSSFSSGPVNAQEKGKLESVRQEFEEPSSTSVNVLDSTSATNVKSVATQSIMDFLMSFFLSGIADTGSQNWPEKFRELKAGWSPALPTLRFEPSYQYVAGGLSGLSAKAEIGYLMLALDGEYMRYFEKAPKDSLDVWQAHFLLRTLFAERIGTNLALGVKAVRGGQNNTGFEFGFPFYIFINKHFIFDILPYISAFGSKTVYDIGGGLSYKYKYFGARAGYRGLFIGGEKLHGPRIGLFFQW